VRTLTTAGPGTKINGGTFTIPDALGHKVFYPFGDFLHHDLGTGDGIAVAMEEHYGRRVYQNTKDLSPFDSARNKVRTAPLWGVRLHSRLMHDGASQTLVDAILRHGGEASEVTDRFKHLPSKDREAIIEFLTSL
jgi:CxxC motif-containing protein (DUF1111 family)